MNVTPSKMMLGISLVAYTYCSWGYLFPDKAKVELPNKEKELTAAVVARQFDTNLARDPFGTMPLERGEVASADLNGLGETSNKDLTLNAIILMPMERVALINGKEVHQGQTVSLAAKGPAVYARKVGEDYVILEAGGQIKMLRLEAKEKPSSGSGSSPAGGRNASVTMGQ